MVHYTKNHIKCYRTLVLECFIQKKLDIIFIQTNVCRQREYISFLESNSLLINIAMTTIVARTHTPTYTDELVHANR